MRLALNALSSARKLTQHLEFDVFNPVDSEHDVCKKIWVTCWVGQLRLLVLQLWWGMC